MQKSVLVFTIFFLLISRIVFAQNEPFEDTPSYEPDQSITWPQGIQEKGGEKALPVKGFGQINVDYEYISPSSLKIKGFQDLGFGEGTASVSYTRLFSLEKGINFGVGYTLTDIWWNPNPFFCQDNFDVLNFNCNGFTNLWKCFELKGGVSASIDTHHWRWDYTFYNVTGWGRYIWKSACFGDVGFNFGATARLGLKGDFVYPIAGIDFTPREDVQVNLVFPVDMMIIFKISKHLSLDLAGRIWNSRRRLGPDEPLSRGYFEYRNAGLEMGAILDFDPIAAANVHIGTTLGTGNVRVSNSKNQNEKIFDISPSPYVGGEVWLRF